jgi:hypothetical protein
MILRGRWCDIIILNVHAPTEDKTDDMKDSFCDKLKHTFPKFLKYYIKILLGDFNAKVCRSLVKISWCVLRLQMEETPSRYGR